MARFARSGDGAEIAFEVEGSGPPLVLLHGGSGSRHDWRTHGYIERLSPEFTVISLDLRGHGESARPTTTDAYRIDAIVDDVVQAARAVGAEKFALWGYSYGANVGRYVAKTGRVTAMVCAGVPFGSAAPAPFAAQVRAMLAQWGPVAANYLAGRMDGARLSDAERQRLEALPAQLARQAAMLSYPPAEAREMPVPDPLDDRRGQRAGDGRRT